MNVEIYDQYRTIYYDNVQDKLVELNLALGEPLDQNRYSIRFEGVGTTVTAASGLSTEDAINLVTELYLNSQTMGSSYDEKILKLNEGYAELIIYLTDGRILSRVIQIVNKN